MVASGRQVATSTRGSSVEAARSLACRRCPRVCALMLSLFLSAFRPSSSLPPPSLRNAPWRKLNAWPPPPSSATTGLQAHSSCCCSRAGMPFPLAPGSHRLLRPARQCRPECVRARSVVSRSRQGDCCLAQPSWSGGCSCPCADCLLSPVRVSLVSCTVRWPWTPDQPQCGIDIVVPVTN